MMLTIEGLPRSTKYKDLKSLVRTQCNINEMLLDGLIVDANGNKTVRIGLPDDRAGSLLIKCLDGFRIAGHVLSVRPVGKNPPSESSMPNYSNYESRENYVAPSYNDYGQSMPDQSQPGPWATSSSQWQGNQIQQQNPQGQDKFNYQHQGQMPSNNTYIQQAPQASQLQEQRSIYPQSTQNRLPQEQSYGYQQKPVTDPNLTQHQKDARSHVLRAVEIVDSHSNAARPQNRYQPGHGYNAPDKPVTIMKDNFQGPTQYNVEPINPHYQTQSHGQPSPWAQQQKPSPYNEERKLVPTDKRQGMVNLEQSRDYKDSSYSMQRSHLRNVDSSNMRRSSPSPRRISPPGRRISPSGRGISPPGRRISPSGRRISPPGRRISPSGRRISPSGRRMSPSGRRMSPSGRRISPSGRRMSPSGRRMSPSGRRMSPSGRRISPSGRLISSSGRRISPPGRRISPPGRRMSPSSRPIMPSGRRISPSGSRMPTTVRRNSPFHHSPAGHRVSPPAHQVLPTAHRMSPGRGISPRRRSQERRMSPGGRRIPDRISPGRMSPHKHIVPGTRPGDPGRRRDSPQRTSGVRFSPTRHLEKTDKYGPPEIRGPSKQPYEMPQASKQAMYSGGYQENVQYPIAGMRQPEQRISAWQEVKPIFTGNVKKDEGRRETYEPFGASDRIEKLNHRSRSPMRRSRSPGRRSPTRDHYNRQSRSPSSQRRSWAYEKRRSPTEQEPPPPPVWPGQRNETYPKKTRENLERIDKEVPPKRMPVWEGPRFTDKIEDSRQEVRRIEEERRFPEDKGIRVHKEMLLNKTIPSSSRREPSPRLRNFKPAEGFSTLQREPKYSPRDDFDRHNEEIHRQDTVYDRKPFIERPDQREPQRSFDRNNRSMEYPQRKEDPHRRQDERRPDYRRCSANLDEEIEDVRKRALELSRKTEEFKLEKRHANNHREYERHGDKIERIKVVSRKERSVSRERRERERVDESRHERQHGSERRHDEHVRTSSADNYSKQKEPEWNMEKDAKRIFFQMNPSSKAKRNKAVEELVEKILAKQNFRSEGTLGRRVMEEVKLAVSRIVNDMFGDQDVSFIEIIIKFNAKYTDRDLTKIFEEVMRSFPSCVRQLKRPAPEPSPSPPKRRSPEPPVKQDLTITNLQEMIPVAGWDLNLMGSSINLPMANINPNVTHMPVAMDTSQFMVQTPYATRFGEQVNQASSSLNQIPPDWGKFSKDEDGYSLYLCKDDFEPFSEFQAEVLRKYLINQIIRETETSQGWAPDFTFKGLQSLCRFELHTKDEESRNWILNSNFSEFTFFNVLVYTNEELWYERAAIWLPGHSRCRNIEPLDKLKMQNSKLDEVNVGKWKFVKKIITIKGTRLYVDMPPSSARCLEKHKMLLSYELQKVNVFLKAVAVDKDAFDNGLKDCSLKEQSELITAAQNSPMPSLSPQEHNIVKITLKGSKGLSVVQARKIKEKIIYSIFKYYQERGSCRTDFVKYGLGQQGFFGVVPENNESKKWLMELNLGKLNKQAIVILNNDESSMRYITMYIMVPHDSAVLNSALILERLKQSNQGVKGLDLSKWKPNTLRAQDRQHTRFSVDMDLESVETIVKMKYQIDYMDDRHRIRTLEVKSAYSHNSLMDIIKKYKSESTDSYDVANMDLASSDENDDDDDVIFIS